MMIIKCLSGRLRWLIRRYKIFVLIGVAILCFQLFLAIKFLAFSKVTIEEKWQPRKATGKNDIETSANSARRAKDGLLDDEDTHQLVKQKYDIPRKKSNVSQLRLEELDFTPQCDITGKEAVSAIHRAKTQKCKKHIANVTCLSLKGVLYPKELPNFCPTGGFIRGKSLGCFKDEKDYRILSGYYGVFKNDNTPISCIHLCLQSGFPYAGVQYSNECFCGNDEPPSISKIADSSCNMKCSGDAHQTCGGYYTSNVFETGIKKFIPQVPNLEPSSNETVRIVFLLTLNGRALRQVKRLLKIIYNKDHYYYIHVDVRQDYLFRELLQLERQFANIRLTRNRFATIWGGASLLEMLRSCMLELLNFDNWRWDFVLNLSESDYPVKHIGRLTEFLTANRGRNFVKSHGREVQRFIQKQGLDKTFVECDAHMWRVADRKLPWGLQVDGGSDWIALNVEFVRYVASDEPDELIRGLLDVFRFTLLPAESFFHTALRNSKFCNTYIDNNLHVTNWKRKLGCKCQYKHVVDWCGCSPNDFKPEDWPRIQGTETRQLYFARKFEPIISQSILQQLELWVLGIEKPFKSKVSINSYWQSVYHHQDLSAADDGLVTLTNAAARSWIKSYNNATCAPIFEKLLEITSYHYKDQYKYTLIKFKASKIIYEIGIKPLNHLSVLKQSPLAGKLESLIVSSDYDQKEQISRNFARVLSPYSDPVLIYEFNPSITSKSYNVTVLWIDPSGKLAEVSGLNLDENNLTGHVKPVLRQPLLPGSWAVKLAHKESLLAEVKFLVTPLEYFGGNPVTNNQVGFIHMGSPGRDYGATYNKFLAKEFDRDILERLSLSNSKRFGLDLQEWIDVLFNKFFTIERFCATKHLDICGKIVPFCYKSSWSSFYPDPKSAMTGLNQTTGMFDIW